MFQMALFVKNQYYYNFFLANSKYGNLCNNAVLQRFPQIKDFHRVTWSDWKKLKMDSVTNVFSGRHFYTCFDVYWCFVASWR